MLKIKNLFLKLVHDFTQKQNSELWIKFSPNEILISSPQAEMATKCIDGIEVEQSNTNTSADNIITQLQTYQFQ